MMRLRAFLCCCVVSACWVGSAFADDRQSIQTQLQTGHGDTTKRLQEVDVFLQQSPADFDALFLKARLLEENNEMAKAEALYRKIISAHPKRPEPYNNLASLLVSNGKLSEAQALLEKAIRTHPSYATIYDNLTKIYVTMARDSYGKALQLDETSSQVSLVSLNSVSQLAPEQTTIKSNIIAKPTTIPTEKKAESIAPNVLANPKQKITPTQALQDRNEIITTLEGWAAAWSEQATDVYFIFYADDYHPPGQSRIAWKKERRVRLNKPRWIQIGLKGIDIKSLKDNEAKVELVQEYRASNYQDKTRKQFKLRQTTDGWRIVEERNLAKIN